MRLAKVNLRPEVKWFAAEMEEKLKKNDHKVPHWSICSFTYLLESLYVELAELESARTPGEIIEEAIDIANFAMMIAHNARERNRKKG